MVIVELLHFLVYGSSTRTSEHIEASIHSHFLCLLEEEFLQWVQFVTFKHAYLFTFYMKV